MDFLVTQYIVHLLDKYNKNNKILYCSSDSPVVWNPGLHSRFYQSSTILSTLRKINLVHADQLRFFKPYLQGTVSSTLKS
jgi:hypothetical protein